MKRALCLNTQEISVTEDEIPTISDRELLIRVQACGLCGSDILKLKGKGLEKPLTLGHEVVGEIEQVGAKVAKWKKGDSVVVAHHVPCYQCHYCQHENFSMCRSFKESNLDPGGFAEYLRIPEKHVVHNTFTRPDHLSMEKALFMEPLACAIRCLKRLPLRPNDTTLIIGMGSIGLLLRYLFQLIPVKTLATDLDDKRLELASMLGARAVHPERDSLKEIIGQETQGRGVDVVLFTAGTTAMLQNSLSWVRDGGTVCLFSQLSGSEMAPIDTTQIYKREITLNSSYSPSPRELSEAFELISAGKIDLDLLPTNAYGLHEIPQAISDTLERNVLKAVIYPHGTP